MIVEREIAGFVLPFTAGVLISAYLPTHFLPSPQTFLICTALCLILLIHPEHKRYGFAISATLIFITTYCCGAFLLTSERMISLSEIRDTTRIEEYALGFANHMKQTISSLNFKREESGAILSALITGDRSGLSAEITETFRVSGASHILALSGLHLGIIYGILKGILYLTGNIHGSRIFKSAVIISICSFYSIATGAGPSIIRALLFIILGETAKLTNRYKSTSTILLAALFIQLSLSPESIRSIGFQLSYAAMVGIAYIYPFIKGLWTENDECKSSRPMKWMWNSSAMSISCQLTTGPLAYLYFGTFPQYFILTNLIALPLVGLVIPFGLLAILLESIGIDTSLAVGVTETLIYAMTESLKIIASL